MSFLNQNFKILSAYTLVCLYKWMNKLEFGKSLTENFLPFEFVEFDRNGKWWEKKKPIFTRNYKSQNKIKNEVCLYTYTYNNEIINTMTSHIIFIQMYMNCHCVYNFIIHSFKDGSSWEKCGTFLNSFYPNAKWFIQRLEHIKDRIMTYNFRADVCHLRLSDKILSLM